MQSLCASAERNALRYAVPMYLPTSRRLGLLIGSVVLLVSVSISAASGSEPPRFQLTGTGTLTLDQVTLKSGNVQLKAYLTPSDAAISASPPVQEGGAFTLMANLAASPTACYNDTIFRDGFDGDGL